MNVALILSGGTGTRLGSEIPKQYLRAGGRPVIAYSLECLSRHGGIDAIQIVADAAWRTQIGEWQGAYDPEGKFRGFSDPGENRQLSIFHGLEDIRAYAEDSDYVLVHDAARPLLTARLVSECMEAAAGHDGALPVLPMKDTVYESGDGKRVSSLLDRSRIFAGQAPEVFLLGKYYEANLRLMPDAVLRVNGSTEPAVMAGMDIVMLPGDERNIKITTRADLERFGEILADGRGKEQMPWM